MGRLCLRLPACGRKRKTTVFGIQSLVCMYDKPGKQHHPSSITLSQSIFDFDFAQLLIIADHSILHCLQLMTIGMYGGFSLNLDVELNELTADSWCRVVGGSEQRHVINRQLSSGWRVTQSREMLSTGSYLVAHSEQRNVINRQLSSGWRVTQSREMLSIGSISSGQRVTQSRDMSLRVEKCHQQVAFQ